MDTTVDFTLSPYLRFMTSGKPLDPEEGVVDPPFSIGLVADGSGAGTQESPLLQGGVFGVSACAGEAENSVFLRVNSGHDSMRCVSAMSVRHHVDIHDIEPQVGASCTTPPSCSQ